MMMPLTAVAPASAAQRLAPVLENVPIARDTYRLRLDDPALARSIRPGQFVMIRPGPREPTTRCSAGPSPSTTSSPTRLGHARRGRRRLPGRRPGHGRPGPAPAGRPALGLGTAGQRLRPASGRPRRLRRRRDRPDAVPGPGPLVAGQDGLRRRQDGPGRSAAPERSTFASSATLLYGVRTAALLAGVDDFRRAGIAVEIATDDGSAGHHGFVTDLLARRLERGERPGRVVGCGPPAMLAALARLVERYRVPCDVSLENHMACGFGACFSCVAPIRQPDGRPTSAASASRDRSSRRGRWTGR